MVKKEKKEVKEETNEGLKNLLKDLQKNCKGSVIQMASDMKVKERIPTGSPEIDEMIGGGIPCGLYSVIWGSKGSAKTSLAYSTIAEAQKLGKVCLFLDLEHTYDAKRASLFGVNSKKLIVAEFVKAEDTMDAIIKLCKEKAVGLIVLDSIQSMSPTGEQESKQGKELSVEHDTQALLARKLGQFFRMSAHYVSVSKCAVLLIGQSRTSIGGYAPIEMLSGGNALMHWSSLIIKLRRGKGADAPMIKRKETYIDEETGKERYRTVNEACGFNLVVRIDKTKIESKYEGNEIQIPFYHKSGFKQLKNEGDADDNSRTVTDVG
jgi:recombination protein RecA